MLLLLSPHRTIAESPTSQPADSSMLPPDPQLEADIKSEMRTRLRHDFSTLTTAHFLLVFDTPPDFAQARSRVLETAHQAFFKAFTGTALEAQPLAGRLVVILFQNRDDYLTYAQQIDHTDLSWTAGFYTQHNNRSAFFDDATGTSAETASADEAKLAQDLDYVESQLKLAQAREQDGIITMLLAKRSEIRSRLMLIKSNTNTISLLANKFKTLHEAAHQLAFNTGIQTQHVDYPFWLAEGLACNFEIAPPPQKPGPLPPPLPGPGNLNILRWATLRKFLNAPRNRLTPSQRDAVSIENVLNFSPSGKMDQDTLALYYAQSWALFHFLYTQNRPALDRLLQAYNQAPRIAKLSPETHRKILLEALHTDMPTFALLYRDFLRTLPKN